MENKKSRITMTRLSNLSTSPVYQTGECDVVAQTDLGLGIDYNETAKNARSFLSKGINKYLYKAGMHRNQLKSPALNLAGGGSSGGNHAEDKIINGMESIRMCRCIKDTLENCEPLTYQIISAVYLEGLKDWQMADKLSYSPSQYQNIKRTALCEFAERFEGFETRYSFDRNDYVYLVKKIGE